MITSWTYSVNSLPQFKYGTINLREEPWWLAVCGWAIDKIGYGCRLLNWIKMPRFGHVVRFGNEYTWRGYYGDVGSLYHCYVHDPLSQWYYAHPKAKLFEIELGYDKVKELFGQRDASFFAEQEKVLTTK